MNIGIRPPKPDAKSSRPVNPGEIARLVSALNKPVCEAAFRGRMEHYFGNPPSQGGRNAVFGYRSLPPWERDDKARGMLYAPQPTKEDKQWKKPDGNIPAYDAPMFDYRGRLPSHVRRSLLAQDVLSRIQRQLVLQSQGSPCSATWSHANIGQAVAAVTAKIGKTKSYAALIDAAERSQRRLARARTPGERRRANEAVKTTYRDLRSHGKVKLLSDRTYETAAYRDVWRVMSWFSPVWKEVAPGPWPNWCGPLVIQSGSNLAGDLYTDNRIWILIARPQVAPRKREPRGRRWFRLFHGEKIREGSKRYRRSTQDQRLRQSSEWLPHNLVMNVTADVTRRKEKRVDMPSEEEACRLAVRAKTDPAARDTLIINYQPLMRKIAKKYAKGSRLSADDLINSAVVGHTSKPGKLYSGMYYAIEKYNPERGSFSSYAEEAIEWAIRKAVKDDQKEAHPSLDAEVGKLGEEDRDIATWRDKAVNETTYNPDTVAALALEVH
jgi:RNA polymerase sigma factor (sigma-70 family)